MILSTYNSGTRVIDCRSPVLPIYKYTEKKYVDDLFENGTILINTFQNLQKLDEKKHGDSDEGSLSTGLIGFDTSRGDKIPNILQQETHLGIPPFAGIAEDSCVLKYSGTTTYRINGYVFSTTHENNIESAKGSFDYDHIDRYRIIKPVRFADVVSELLEKKIKQSVVYTGMRFCHYSETGRLVNDDNYDTKSKLFTKSIRYKSEKEYRFVFGPESIRNLAYQILVIPKAEIRACLRRE